METLFNIFFVFFGLRMLSLFFSIYNERRIVNLGAEEYGKTNSLMLTLVHVLYYFSCIYEAYFKDEKFDWISQIGLLIMIFSYLALYLVIFQLRAVWTLKVYILPDHPVVKNWFFKTFKHPNYFLNVIPEIIGLGLMCKSWISMLTLLPVYFIVLRKRILIEEDVMKSKNLL